MDWITLYNLYRRQKLQWQWRSIKGYGRTDARAAFSRRRQLRCDWAERVNEVTTSKRDRWTNAVYIHRAVLTTAKPWRLCRDMFTATDMYHSRSDLQLSWTVVIISPLSYEGAKGQGAALSQKPASTVSPNRKRTLPLICFNVCLFSEASLWSSLRGPYLS